MFQKYSIDIIKKKKLETFINEVNKIAQKIGHKRAGIMFAKKSLRTGKRISSIMSIF